MSAIFRDAHQAIRFAYLVEDSPVRQESTLSRAYQCALREMDGPGERSTINLGGLSDLEVRGQAAMIRVAVELMLPRPESWAIRSRYGGSRISRTAKGVRLMVFSPNRSAAMQALADYQSGAFSPMPNDAMLLLIARVCAESDCLRPTLQQIVEHGGTSHATVARNERKLAERVRALINAGLGQLEPMFRREGLIANEIYNA